MSGGYLRRYTQLPSLIYTLTERKLTLLDPQSWADTNDSYYMGLYRETARLKSLLALCFTLDSETFHHWKVFAPGPAGVCIEFERNELTERLQRHPGIQVAPVQYIKLPDRRKMRPDPAELPFIKRYGFRHEEECRAVYASLRKVHPTLDVKIKLTDIARIRLSPWLPLQLRSHVVKTLRGIRDCGNLSIVRSTLISNQEWKDLGRKAADKVRRSTTHRV